MPSINNRVSAMASNLGVKTGLGESEGRTVRGAGAGRLVDPGEVAETILLCVENGAINGQGINIDGGAVQS